MAAITIRGLDESVKRRLRVRAAEHGRSMEAEARAIIESSLVRSDQEYGLGTELVALFSGHDPVEPPARSEPARAATFD